MAVEVILRVWPARLDVVVGAAQTGGAHPDAATVGTEIDGDGGIGAEHLALHGVLAAGTPRGALRRPSRAARSDSLEALDLMRAEAEKCGQLALAEPNAIAPPAGVHGDGGGLRGHLLQRMIALRAEMEN